MRNRSAPTRHAQATTEPPAVRAGAHIAPIRAWGAVVWAASMSIALLVAASWLTLVFLSVCWVAAFLYLRAVALVFIATAAPVVLIAVRYVLAGGL